MNKNLNKTEIKVPKGWILVPINPTVEMLDAAEECYERSYTGIFTASPMVIWDAMIKAHKKSVKKKISKS